jgi:hypothetical protein
LFEIKRMGERDLVRHWEGHPVGTLAFGGLNDEKGLPTFERLATLPSMK